MGLSVVLGGCAHGGNIAGKKIAAGGTASATANNSREINCIGE
jgi:hypothetical protein